jgi:formylglycine-generating enzyme required for sulfatase activity
MRVFSVASLVGVAVVFAGWASLSSGAAEETELDRLLKRFVDEFVAVTPGKGEFPAKFTQGNNAGPASEQPAREVTLATPFAIAKYEMPQNLYEAVMGANPSRWKGPRNSVEMMSFRDAQTCCAKLTTLLRERKLIAADETIRLPTEAEWEYCCRAGTTTLYGFGDDIRKTDDPPKKNSILDKYGWYTGNAAGNDPPVGALAPNAWGLFDMHGYLWEFTSDAWTPSYEGVAAMVGPRLPKDADAPIVLRSGSWKDPAERLTSAARRSFAQTAADDAVGFRCVRSR